VTIESVCGAAKRYGIKFVDGRRKPKKKAAQNATKTMADYARQENAAMRRVGMR
jgi:hypothetical protein